MPAVDDLLGPAPSRQPAPGLSVDSLLGPKPAKVAAPKVTSLLGERPQLSDEAPAPTPPAPAALPPAQQPKIDKLLGPAPAAKPDPADTAVGRLNRPNKAGFAPVGDIRDAAVSAWRGSVAANKEENEARQRGDLVGTAKGFGKKALANAALVTSPLAAISEPIARGARALHDGPVGQGLRKVSTLLGSPPGKISEEEQAQRAEMLGGFYSALPVGGSKAPALRGAVEDSRQAVAKILAPSTVTPEATKTAQVIRRAGGEANLQAERAAHDLLRHEKLVGNLPVPEQRALVAYIERRGKGAKLADPKTQAAADTVKKVYEGYRSRIEYVMKDSKGDVPGFIEDYYAHMWQERPKKVADTMNAYFSRQGTGRNLKRRTIPTIEDGIAAGLTPRTENPIQATTIYAQNMSRFLATHDIQGTLDKMGYTGRYTPGQEPPGWRQLNGINTEKLGQTVIKDGEIAARQLGTKLYAPEAVARVYNNFISKGLESGDLAPFAGGARKVANAVTMAKLGLSAFHLTTMTHEANISELARAYGALTRGKPLTAGKALLNTPVAAVTSTMRGERLQKELLGLKTPDSLSAKVNEAYVRSGQRLRMDRLYRSKEAGSFYDAVKRGTWKRELNNAAQRLYKGTPWEKATGTVDAAANVIQSTAAPLFEELIPRMKQGAFASRMEDFLREHPGATQDEVDKYAIRLGDSIDNRFGELVQDNLFWHRWMKQVSQVLLLSPTWNIGTLREIGGGLAETIPSAKGLLTGKGITDKTAYVAALATVVALENGVLTYMSTGEEPKGRDFMAYRTGGVDASSGEPERGMVPGYQKDVYAFGYNFPHNIAPEVANKLNPALSTALTLATGKDRYGKDAFRPQGAEPIEGEPDLWSFGLDAMMPISIGQFNQRKKGSKIGSVERVLGVRPAPAYITDPEGVKANREKYANRDWRQVNRSKRKRDGQMEGAP